MGFFTDLIQTVAPLAGAFLGVPTTAIGGAQARGLAPIGETPAQATARRVAQAVAGGVVTLPAAQVAGAGCPTGSLRRRTIVETFDPATGVVCRTETLKGAPAVMNSDVAASNRLNRQLSRLNKKQPRKTVKQSTAARLKEEVVESALRGAIQNGHHPAAVIVPGTRCP